MDIKMLTFSFLFFFFCSTDDLMNIRPQSGCALRQVQHVIAAGYAGETGLWWLMRGEGFRL